MELLDIVENMAESVEEKWAILRKHAPEVDDFYKSILYGGDNYAWWEDKPLQIINRFALYAGELARQRDAAIAKERARGRKERTVEITEKREHYPECFEEGDK